MTAIDKAQIAFQEVFGTAFQMNVLLSRYTSARVGGPADLFLTVRTAEQLQQAVELAYEYRIPYFILGGGSNVLVSDRGVRGLVILNRARKVTYRNTGISLICTAESGMNLSTLVRKFMAQGFAGFEWAIGIPGTVGGAVVGNSGAHGGEMAGNIRAATIWEPGRGVCVYGAERLRFGYRDSTLKREQGRPIARRVVLSVEFELKERAPIAEIRQQADAFTEHRKRTQPGGASTGSMFKNPENYYAGYLIESAGLKGATCGDAAISDKHANFFVNNGDALAEDLRALIAEAWNAVRDQFGVEMALEVELVGEWEF